MSEDEEEDFEQAQARLRAEREHEAEQEKKRKETERKRKETERKRKEVESLKVENEASTSLAVPKKSLEQEVTENVVAAMKAENVVLESRIKELEATVKEMLKPTSILKMLPLAFRPGTTAFESAILNLIASINPGDLPNNSIITRKQKQGNRTSHIKDAIRLITHYYEKGGYL